MVTMLSVLNKLSLTSTHKPKGVKTVTEEDDELDDNEAVEEDETEVKLGKSLRISSELTEGTA